MCDRGDGSRERRRGRTSEDQQQDRVETTERTPGKGREDLAHPSGATQDRDTDISRVNGEGRPPHAVRNTNRTARAAHGVSSRETVVPSTRIFVVLDEAHCVDPSVRGSPGLKTDVHAEVIADKRCILFNSDVRRGSLAET